MEIAEFFKQLQEESAVDKKRIAELEAVINEIGKRCGTAGIGNSEKRRAAGKVASGQWLVARILATSRSQPAALTIIAVLAAAFLLVHVPIKIPGNIIPIKNDTVSMSAQEAEIVTSAIDMVKTDTVNGSFTDIETVKEALRSEMPSRVRDVVIAEIKADTVDELPAALDAVKKKIKVK